MDFGDRLTPSSHFVKKVLLLFILLILANGKLVTAVVIWIIRVTLDPMEPHLVFIQQIEQTPPEFRIFCGFLIAFNPAARTPALSPALGNAVNNILAVRIQIDQAR